MHITPEIKQLARRLDEQLKESAAAKRDCPTNEFSPEEAHEVFLFDLQKWFLQEQLAGNITIAPKPPTPEDANETPSFLEALFGGAKAS